MVQSTPVRGLPDPPPIRGTKTATSGVHPTVACIPESAMSHRSARTLSRRSLVLGLAGLCALSSCGLGGGSQRTGEDILRSTGWGLVDVDLDRRFLANRGVLPTFDPAPPGSRVQPPTVMGKLTVDQDGNVVCEITAFETPTISSGTPIPFTHQMVRFSGVVEKGAQRMVKTRTPPRVRLGEATIIHILAFEQRGRVVLLQASTDDKMLPYIYRFRRTSSASNRVLAPTL